MVVYRIYQIEPFFGPLLRLIKSGQSKARSSRGDARPGADFGRLCRYVQLINEKNKRKRWRRDTARAPFTADQLNRHLIANRHRHRITDYDRAASSLTDITNLLIYGIFSHKFRLGSLFGGYSYIISELLGLDRT